MRDHFNIPSWWFGKKSVYLSPHLPRLLLAHRYQPRYVRRCAVTQQVKAQLELLDWDLLPTTLGKQRHGYHTIPISAYVAAYLVKIERQLPTMGQLHRFLREHPALIWALGFPLVPDKSQPHGFNAERSLPIQRHFNRKLSDLPNEIIQNLLDGQVAWLQMKLGTSFGEVVSIDTKHIVAWVKENNPKAFGAERYDKSKQPAGDPDCKLGCKRKKNQKAPSKEGQPANEKVSIGEYYWGYASGAVVTKLPRFGEFVLAECTQTFDYGDSTYFLPLMTQVESRLGRRPLYGTADAAFDAFYVYDYFNSKEHDGFAAIPLRQNGVKRIFDGDGLPICEANLAMVCKRKFTNRTTPVKHQRGRYVCPLLFPDKTADSCPVNHKKWENGGCKLTMPTCAGARVRYQLDREGGAFKQIYAQRTAVERIFSQAVALGIERPKLRNQQAITNYNTLIYILINLRAMQKVSSLMEASC